VVGWDPRFDYDAMRRATVAVNGGAGLFASNDDPSFPAEKSMQWPGAGAILASIETACGQKATVFGKPHRPMMEAAARRLGGERRVAIVGDRPETDLLGGRDMGWITILVLTGVTSSEQASGLDPQPDHVLPSLRELA
jgi:HAD superfamily hydrolase (TIGR01450 family)